MVGSTMSSKRWQKFRQLRHELLLAVDTECRAEHLEALSRDERLPYHIRCNFKDSARRIRDEAKYVKQARRELR